MALMLVFSINSWGQETINIVQNGDFENWTDALPDNWMGSKSSITAANVIEYSTSVQSGAKACQLIEESTSHKRFTTEPLTILANTEYTVTYYARGKGEIRNAFYRDANYSAYSAYTVLDSDSWTEIVYTFEYTAAVADVEVIFSVRSTDAIRDHIQIDNVSITYQDMAGVVATPTFSPNGGSFFADTDVTIETTTENATVYYSTVAIDGPWVEYTAPVTVTETTTLYAYATATDLTDSNVATATFDFPAVMDVADVAALRAGTTDGTFYRLTGEAILTYQQSFRNQKFIQDATAGIMIDDNGGVITTAYDVYDGISGIIGTISVFGGMVQFVPAVDPGTATSSANEVEPMVISLQEFNDNFMDYQAMLVTIENVSFDVADGTDFANGQVYPITDGTLTAEFRTTFWGVDYIGQPVPAGNWNITGLPNSNSDVDYITARNQADFEEYVAPFVEIFQAIPAYFNVTGHTERGFAVDANNVYVASRNGGIFVKVHDRLTGAVTGDLVTTGITGGTFVINDVEVTADGVILAANMAMGDAGIFKIYQMDAIADPVVLIEYPVTGGRFGDKFTVVGSMSDGSAVIYAANGSAAEVVKWSMEADGEGFAFGEPETISIAVANGGTPVVAPLPDGSFYYTASGHGVSKLNADGTLIGAVSTDLVASSSTAMKYLGTEGTDEFLAIYQNGTGNENIRVIRLINGDPTDAVIEFVTPSMFVNANPNGTGDVAFIPNLAKETGNVDLYVMGTNNGVGGYTSQNLSITFPVYLPQAEPTYTVTFVVEDTDGVAITDAVVTFDGVANAAGEYVFTDVLAGTYDYAVVADGYNDAAGTAEVVDVDLTVTVIMVTPSDPALVVTPETLDVGHAVPGINTAQGSVILSNEGVSEVEIADGAITFTGAQAGLFSYELADSELTFPLNIGFEETVELIVTFNPDVVGEAAAEMVIAWNSPDMTDAMVTLSGTGYDAYTYLLENFDSYEDSEIPSPWTGILDVTGGSAFVDLRTVGSPNSAPHHVRLANGDNTEGDVMLVSPVVTDMDVSWIRFFAKMGVSSQVENLAVGYMTDPADVATFVALDTIAIDGTYTQYVLSLADLATEIVFPENGHFVFKHNMETTYRVFYLDDIVYETQPAVAVFDVNKDNLDFGEFVYINNTAVQSLVISNTGVGTMTINETDINITGADAAYFNLVYAEDMVWPIELGTAETFELTIEFTPDAVRAFVADLEIEDNIALKALNVIPLTGSGYDPTVTPPYMADFIGDFPPMDWTRWEGELNDTTEVTPVTSIWTHAKFARNLDLPEENSAKINIYGSSRNHWLVTPPVDLGDGTVNQMLSFDVALNAWNTSEPGTMGPNQYFAVVISTDNGETWVPANILQMWGAEDAISHTGEKISLDLTGYTGIVKFGFYGESRSGGGDVDLYVTNVDFREIQYFTTTFNVKDSDGVDITDATVTLDEETLTAAPYLFENLLFGNYDYTISKTGYITESGVVSIEDTDVVIDVVLQNAYAVDFAVTDGTNPIIEAAVDIYDDTDMHVASLLTDINGEASVMLPAGNYTYDVTGIGYDAILDQPFTLVDVDLSFNVVLTGPAPMMLPFAEDFNDQLLPTDWLIINQDDHTAEVAWEFTDALGGNSLNDTPFAIIDSDAAGSGGIILNSILYTPAIDASAVTGTLVLSFEQYYRHIGASSFGKVEVWNGTEWINLATYTETLGSWTEPDMAVFDITEHANNQLRVRFHYNDAGSWAWYWAIDNVEVKDLQEYTLTLNVNPEGWGTVTGAGLHLETLPVEVAAIPSEGYAFLNWTDVDGVVVSTEAESVITMPSEDLTLTANFAPGAVDAITMNMLLDKTGDNLPPEIGSGGNARSAALYQDRYVVVASRENGPNVWVWDSYNPHLEPFALDMGTDIIAPVTFPINYVRTVGDDIYVSNLSLDPSGEGWGQGVFQIYRWSGLESTPEVVVSYTALPGRLGDAFSIIGDPAADGHIIAHINTSIEFRKWNFVGGVLQNEDNPDLITLATDLPHINNHGIINPIEGETDMFVLTSNNVGILIVNMNGDILAEMNTDVIEMRTYDPNIFYHNGNRYLSYTINNEANVDIGARHQVVDISVGATVIEAIENISTSGVLADRIVYDQPMGAGHANLTATNQVSIDENGEVVLLAHVVGKGFMLETTGALPATYALTVVAEPAEGGVVTGEGDYYEGATVPVTATAEAGYEFVNWTIGGTEVSTEASFDYTMPAEATTLTANFDLVPVIDVATLAELRALPADGTVYRYTGNAVIVAMDGFRNRKFIQDETAAILIDDQPGVITTEYVLYDVITNVVGQLNVWNNLVRFQPEENTEPATENTPVEPYPFMIADITSADQAKLVKLHNVTFTGVDDGDVFVNGTNYTITDGENTMVFRTDFWDVDYIGEPIPLTAINITGVIGQYQEDFQITARFAADIEEYVAPFSVTFNVNMSTAEGFDPETDVVYMTGDLLGWAEPGTDPDNQTMERVGDSWIWTNTLELQAGTYEYKYFLNAGWDGGEWEGGDNRSVTVDADMTVNDVWGTDQPMFTLSLLVDPENSGTVSGDGLYAEGEEIAVSAAAETGFQFVNWTDADENVVSTEADFTYTMPAMDVVLIANFDVQPSVGQIGAINLNVFPNPATDNFSITANSTIRSIMITDITGKVVYNDVINDNEIRINNSFGSGIYLVRIHTDEGVFVRKLQIQK